MNIECEHYAPELIRSTHQIAQIAEGPLTVETVRELLTVNLEIEGCLHDLLHKMEEGEGAASVPDPAVVNAARTALKAIDWRGAASMPVVSLIFALARELELAGQERESTSEMFRAMALAWEC